MTDKQKVFINAYFLHNMNATKAAEIAGYANPNVNGHRIKNEPEVVAEIDRRMTEHAMSANEALYRLGRQARASIFDVLELDDFTRKPIMNLDYAYKNGTGDLISGVGYNERGMMELKIHDSQSALNLVGRHHKLFTDKQEVSGGIEFIDRAAETLEQKLLRRDAHAGEGSVSSEPDAA